MKRTSVLFKATMGLVLATLLALGRNALLTVHAASTRSVLAGSAPAWANAKNYMGAASANDTIGFRIYLG